MNAIYLALHGQSKGPYTLAQVRGSLANGEVTRETPAWYEGLADWATVGSVLDASGGATAPAVPASVTTTATASPGEFTKDELRRIAKRQNLLMWSVLAGISALFLAHITLWGLPIVLGVLALKIYAVWSLGTAIRIPLPLVCLLCLGMFIPYVSLLILLVVSARATKILQAAGVYVGLMGGHAKDIED